MRVKRVFDVVGKYTMVLLVSVVMGLVLLIGAYALPTERIVDKVSSEIEQLVQETDYFSSYGPAVYGSTQDNYTEAIYLGQAMIGGINSDLMKNALSGYFATGDGTNVGDMALVLEGEYAFEPVERMRFWNGWQVFLKPMLQVLSYSEIRYFNIIVQTFLLFGALMLLHKKNMSELQFPFLFACLFMNPVTMGMSMTFSGYYYEILIASIIVIAYNDKLVINNRYGIFFAVLGILVFYFNMNYFQLCTIGFPLVLYFYMNKKETIVELLFDVIKYGASWLFGFFGMMLGKWTLYAVFVDSSIFVQQLRKIIERTGTDMGGYNASRLSAIMRNLVCGFNNKVLAVIEISYVIGCIILLIRSKSKKRNIVVADFVFVIVTIVVVLMRYFIEANHSFVHYWVVYRNLAICVFAINTLLARMIKNNREVIEVKNE